MEIPGKKILRFFDGNGTKVYSDGLRRCMELCPECKLEDLLPLYFLLTTHMTAHLPLPYDEKLLCSILSEQLGIDAAKAKKILTDELYPLYGRVDFYCAARLLKYPLQARRDLLLAVLQNIPPEKERNGHVESVMKDAGVQLELSAGDMENIFTQDDKRRRTKKLMVSSGLGLILALLVLLLFVISAVWLRTVFFGLICAYLCLPLERFFEKYVVETRLGKWLSCIFMSPFVPALKLRDLLMARFRKGGVPLKTEAEQQQAENRDLAVKSAVLTLFSVVLLMSALLGGIYYGVTEATDYVNNSSSVRQTAQKVDNWFLYAEESLQWKKVDPDESLKQTLQTEIKSLLKGFYPALSEDSNDESSGVLAILSGLGSFLFDLLMFFFFFFFFLYQMALFRIIRRREKEKSQTPDDVAVWLISKMADSPWVPEISMTAREEAKLIIGRVFWMFNRWVRGYCSIIILEGLLYWTFFHIFNVPFATPLALVASLTILLPFLGPTISFLLSAGVVLLFADSVGYPLIGVIITYSFINGFLEQIFLYPILVGEAIGLTSLETIIVVLFGGVVAGIPGMIFAVPIAALCKFLLPLAWKVFNPFARAAGETDSSIT